MVDKRQIENLEKAGVPVCEDCCEIVTGESAIRAWRTNGHRCPVCEMDVVLVHDNAWLSVPPRGISWEE
jgi:hypothetical protein